MPGVWTPVMSSLMPQRRVASTDDRALWTLAFVAETAETAEAVAALARLAQGRPTLHLLQLRVTPLVVELRLNASRPRVSIQASKRLQTSMELKLLYKTASRSIQQTPVFQRHSST